MNSFLIFLMGFLAGLGCSAIFLLGALLDRLNNTGGDIISSIGRVAAEIRKEKGLIIEPKSDEMIAMEETFERNDREGKDTLIGEIESNVDR